MCGHLMAAGYSATVYSRTRQKAESLLARGAQWAATPRAVAEQSDVVFSIVGFPTDVREVLLGDSGALRGAAQGAVLVDMTTSQPSLAVEIYQAAMARGVHSVDAPVSGGDIGARNATLSIMLGATRRRLSRCSRCGRRWAKRLFTRGRLAVGSTQKW